MVSPLGRESRLKGLLDDIWRKRLSFDGVHRDSLLGLSERDWMIIGAWDAAALLGPSGGQVRLTDAGFDVCDTWGKHLFSGTVSSTGTARNSIRIEFPDASKAVSVKRGGENEPITPVQHEACRLLVAMECIRDHLDSALLVNQSYRNEALGGMARSCGLDDSHFLRLCVWYDPVSRCF